MFKFVCFLVTDEVDEDEEYYDDDTAITEPEMGVLQMLRQHQQNDGDEADEIFGAGFEEEDY